MTLDERLEWYKKIKEDLLKDGLRMEQGTFTDGWYYRFSIPLNKYNKLKGKK